MGLTLDHGIDDRNNSSNYEYGGQVSETVPPHMNQTAQFGVGRPPQRAAGAATTKSKPKRPALMLQLTDEEDRGKPEVPSRSNENTDATYEANDYNMNEDGGLEESKISNAQSHYRQPASNSHRQ